MLAEGCELWIEFGVVVAGLEHSGLEVVEHKQAWHTTPVAKGVFDSTDEAFGVLPQHHFGVALARVAQGDAQHVNFLSLACQLDPQRSVVDLGLLTGFAFHAPDALWIGLLELRYEAFDGLVGMLELVVIDEILPDAFGVELGVEFCLDDLAITLTVALPTTIGIGDALLLVVVAFVPLCVLVLSRARQ